MAKKKCEHTIISTYEPVYENGEWNFEKWHGQCHECKAKGILIDGEGFIPDPNAQLRQEVEGQLGFGAYEKVEPKELKPRIRKWTKNRILDALEADIAHGFTMSGPDQFMVFRLHDKKLGKKAAKTALKELSRE